MINKKEIESIPLEGNIEFRNKSIEVENSALLIVDVQKGEYNQEYIKNALFLLNNVDLIKKNKLLARKQVEEKWNIKYSYDNKKRPMVYNTGVVVISKKGLQKMKKSWPSFQEYIDVIQRANQILDQLQKKENINHIELQTITKKNTIISAA